MDDIKIQKEGILDHERSENPDELGENVEDVVLTARRFEGKEIEDNPDELGENVGDIQATDERFRA